MTPNRVVAPPSYAGTDEYGGLKLSNAINKPFASIGSGPRQKSSPIHDNGEKDLLSAFEASSSVKITNSSNGLVSNDNGVEAGELNGGNHQKPAATSSVRNPSGTRESHTADPDDDPFGLGSLRVEHTLEKKQSTATADDDDILGALGRPVSAFPPLKEREQSPPEIIPESMGPAEMAWARLIDMGFSPEKSREALEKTESGLDVEAAVSSLLNEAHQDSSKTSRLQDKTSNSQRRRGSRAPVDGEKNPEKYAAEFGTTFLKTANSLWKTGTKKLNQAVSELNFDNESNQPKWMREAQVGADNRRSRPQGLQSGNSSDDERQTKAPHRSSKSKRLEFTDEVLQLESGDGRPPRRHPRQQQAIATTTSLNSSREKSPASIESREQELRPPRSTQSPQIQDKKSLRKAVEEQTLNNYISPARRKKTAPKPSSPEPNLLFDAFEREGSHSQASMIPPVHSASRILSQSPDPSRSLPATRIIPEISSMVLQTCTKSRLEGTSAFKIGDYPRATANYTTALSALPPTHPLNIVLYTNRALAHLKTGDPKSSIADSESALSVIGPSRGAHETIDLGGTEGSKDMKVFWTKAMTRQAEALEQLERWSDAAAVWKSCVEAGVGGATSIAGRNRCEKAAAGPSQTPRALKPTASEKRRPKPDPKISALEYLSADTSRTPSLADSRSQSAEAVTRLRRANAAAERLDDEKFALADQVSERLAKWRAGKEGNLRALLASLENVLWEGAGWKKVGMSELILAGKVKVIYMRGIGKVHPDKVILHLYFSISPGLLIVVSAPGKRSVSYLTHVCGDPLTWR